MRPLWTVNTDRVLHVRTPADGLEFEVRMSTGGWHEEIEALLDETLRSPAWCDQLDLFSADAEEHGRIAFDQVICLCHYRVQTLTVLRRAPRSLLEIISTSAADAEDAVAEFVWQCSM